MGKYYIQSKEYIYRYNLENEELSAIIPELKASGGMTNIYIFDSEYVYVMFSDSKNYPAGVYRVDSKGGTLEPYFLFD